MKILFVSYHFPPDPAVGALRAGNVARMLVARGHDVHVLTGPNAGLAPPPPQERLTVEQLSPSFDIRTRLATFAGRKAAATPGAGTAGPVAWTPPAHPSFLRRQFYAALWLPDDKQGWILAVVRRGRQIIADHDVLITSAPPFSAHVAGIALKRASRSNMRWIAEFRDPWTDSPFKGRFARAAWSDAIERHLERRTLRHADHVVAVAEGAASLFRGRMPGNIDKVALIRNGIGNLARPTQPDAPNGRIVYIGNLYHARDPRPFLQGIARLRRSGVLPDTARVDLVGDCRHFRGIDLATFAADLDVGDIVQTVDRVTHDRSLDLIRSASALLLLAQDQPLQVPNKLYEYLGAGRPIIAFADAEGETARVLRAVGGHEIVTSDDPSAIDGAIQRILARNGVVSGENVSLLEEWTTDQQLLLLAEIVEGRRPRDV